MTSLGEGLISSIRHCVGAKGTEKQGKSGQGNKGRGTEKASRRPQRRSLIDWAGQSHGAHISSTRDGEDLDWGTMPSWRYNCGHGGEKSDRLTLDYSICTEESVVNQSSTAFCPHCGAAVNFPSSFCGACGQPLENPAPPAPAAQPQYPPPPSPQPIYGSVPQGPATQCPFCHSTQVQAGKRGWKWYAGYVGSGNVVWTCQSCGKTF